MVNVGRNSLSQEFYPSRDNWARNNRQFIDISQEARFNPPATHGYPQPIETALRECAQIPVKEFALIVMLENGEEKTYSSTSLKPHWQKLFNDRFRRDFHQCAQWVNTEASFPSSAYSQESLYDPDFDSSHDYRKHSSSGDSSSDFSRRYRSQHLKTNASGDDRIHGKRKRTQYLPDDDTPVPPVQRFQELTIGDEAEVTKFYHVRFKDMQQSSCKVMGKAFVKLVEPKKQTHHPYTKGDSKAPPWWPKGDNYVKHKEPDHLLKPDRIRLLVHILRMLIEPLHNQEKSIQKLELNVKALEDVTMEAMSNWFSDKDHPENAAKRPYLKEIFKVAKFEERYRNGELDATATVPVMYGERGGDDSDGDEEGLKEEADDHESNAPTSDHMSTPESIVSPSVIQSSQHSQFESKFEPDAPNMVQQRPHPLMISRHHQTHMEEQTSFLDTSFARPMGPYLPTSPNVHDLRRPYAPAGFSSPQQTMYSGTGWQNNSMVSNSTMSSNFCIPGSSQPASVPTTTSYQLPLPPLHVQQQSMPPPQSGSHFPHSDGLPNLRQSYEPAPAIGNQLRTGSLGHPHQMPQNHGYGDFLHDTTNFSPHDVDMKEEQHIRQS